MTPSLSSIELFAGGGGMALGMRVAGFDHSALVEWQSAAAAVLRGNSVVHPGLWGEDDVIEDDVRSWMTDVTADGVDLVAGGPPCQPFSLAGVHAGDNDERNMFPASIEVLRRARPRMAVFENVPGLLRPGFRPYFDYVKAQMGKPTVRPKRGELWTDHYRRVNASNPRGLRYRVYEQQIDAADYGVPQRRQRVFLVAIRSDVRGADSWSQTQPTHSRDVLLYEQWVTGEYWERYNLPRPPMPESEAHRVGQLRVDGRPIGLRWQTIRDALVGLEEPVDGVDSESHLNHRGIPGARAYKSHSGSPIDLPSKAIKAGVHGVAGGEAMLRRLDGTLRYLTVREAARMQGFPDDYEFSGSRSRMMAAIGNAVAAPVAEMIARRLRLHCGLGEGLPALPILGIGRKLGVAFADTEHSSL